MDEFYLLKTLHILSSTVLFGTGLGIAFLNFFGQCQSSISDRYLAARLTVLMDFLFTMPAVILQPISGIGLIVLGGHEYDAPWLIYSYFLYALAGVCWVPVVFIQIRLRNFLKDAVQNNLTVSELPRSYHRLLRTWFFLGWPAFCGLMLVFYFMVSKVGVG